MRKFLKQKFWSQGTPLGYLGPRSQADLGLGFCRFQIWVIWGPYDYPVLVACQGTAKNPKSAGARCGLNSSNVFLRAWSFHIFLNVCKSGCAQLCQCYCVYVCSVCIVVTHTRLKPCIYYHIAPKKHSFAQKAARHHTCNMQNKIPNMLPMRF